MRNIVYGVLVVAIIIVAISVRTCHNATKAERHIRYVGMLNLASEKIAKRLPDDWVLRNKSRYFWTRMIDAEIDNGHLNEKAHFDNGIPVSLFLYFSDPSGSQQVLSQCHRCAFYSLYHSYLLILS